MSELRMPNRCGRCGADWFDTHTCPVKISTTDRDLRLDSSEVHLVVPRWQQQVDELRSVLGDLCAAAEKVDVLPNARAYISGKYEVGWFNPVAVDRDALAALRSAVVKARQVRGEETE